MKTANDLQSQTIHTKTRQLTITADTINFIVPPQELHHHHEHDKYKLRQHHEHGMVLRLSQRSVSHP